MHYLKIALFILLLYGESEFVQAQPKIVRQTLVYADTLAMDLFLPDNEETNRPVLIYVHGGGFSGGKRDLPNHIAFCEYFAKKGWITATISYHLTMKGQSFSCDQPVQNKIATFAESARNIHQSVAYLIERVDELAIDPDRIVISGSSAGAEAVMHAAYWSKTKKGILPPDFSYAGVISMAGALLDINWINELSAVPTALFHGTCDNLVPYGNASHHYCEPDQTGYMMLYGSYAVADRLNELDRSYYFMTDCGGGHEWNEYPIREKYLSMIEDFLAQDVLKKEYRQLRITLKEGSQNCDYGFCN